MLTLFVRSVILYLLVIVILRAMGKRLIGQMQPYELVITLMIAEFAASPLESVSQPLAGGLMPIFALALVNCILSIITFKSKTVQRLVGGSPAILIRNGKIDQMQLKKQALTVADLLEYLRVAGYGDAAQVGIAVLEPCGQISVFPISQARGVTTSDLHLQTNYETLPITLVLDGQVQTENLQSGHFEKAWLDRALQTLQAAPKELLLLTVNHKGEAQAQWKDPKKPLQFFPLIKPEEVRW